MPMTQAPGMIAIGDHAYLLPSPAQGMTDCLVLAHGGSIDVTRKFDVPANLTVAFLTAAGTTYHGPGPMGVYRDLWKNFALPVPAQRYSGTRPCPDYILAKAFGTFWHNVAEQSTYLEAHRDMSILANAAPGAGANWLPHLIAIRNRKVGKQNVWLSTLIRDIAGSGQGITRVLCANCRDDVSTDYSRHRKTVNSGALGSRTGR